MKNNICKVSFIPQMIAVLIFFSISIPVVGQEMIRGAVDYLLCDTSIVRGITRDTTLVYNRNLTSIPNTTSSFSFVMESNPTHMWTLYIDSLYVNDFELFERYVYFCGYKTVEGGKRAMLGYFKLDDYPDINFYYYVLDDSKELKKLDVYKTVEFQYYEQTHLVATGTTSGSRSDVLVDMAMFTPWTLNCHMYFSNDENENFDDVAVTDKYVVVSSRSKIQNIPYINLWYYQRPHFVGQHIFNNNVDYCYIHNPVPTSPVILEFTKIDSFVAVYKEEGFSRIAMLKMDAMNPNYDIFEIEALEQWPSIPIDVKYQYGTSLFDILARVSNYQKLTFDPLMHIYHVTPNDLNGISPNGNITRYTDINYHLWSLDKQKGLSSQFIVSGAAGQIPKLFRFYYNRWNDCTDSIGYRYFRG